MIRKARKHGDARKGNESPLYRIWQSMRQRCGNPKAPGWKYWGGRGVQIRWGSYEEFRADMGPLFKPGLIIDRIDNNGHYERGNCRWITRREQTRNYSRNRILEFHGERLPMVVWAERLGIGQTTFRARLEQGWSMERTMHTPDTKRHFDYRGERVTLLELAKRYGLKYGTLWMRLKRGASLEEAVR